MPLSRRRKKARRRSAFGRTGPHFAPGELTIEGLFDSAKRARRRRGAPRVLYHYTTWEAAENIIASQRFRATAHACTNDPAELASADGTILEAIAAARERTRGMIAGLLDSFFRTYKHKRISASPRCCLICFSKTRDDPHQWHEYGARGTGVCLGLRLFEIPEPRIRKLASQFLLVQYDESGWRSTFDEWLDRFTDVVSRETDTEDNWRLGLDCLTATTTAWALTAKLPKWAPEREVRMIFLARENERIQPIEQIRSDGSIRRYIEVPVTSLRRMPVAEIIVGPRNDLTVATERAIRMLASAKYRNPEAKVAISNAALDILSAAP